MFHLKHRGKLMNNFELKLLILAARLNKLSIKERVEYCKSIGLEYYLIVDDIRFNTGCAI